MKTQAQPHLHQHVDHEAIAERRQAIQRIRDNHREKLIDAKRLIATTHPESSSPRTSQPTLVVETSQRVQNSTNKQQQSDKNKGVSDTDRMLFDKKFKNFLNHKGQYLSKARRKVKAARKAATKVPEDIGDAEYYNEEEVLSNTGSDYQYKDAEDMQAAYDQMLTGKKAKSGKLQLYHCQMYENLFREEEFRNLLECGSQEEQQLQSVSKENVLNQLFDDPSVMMLYSINPYTLADQLAEFETQNNDFMNYLEFSAFLLTDREPTYFDYTQENIAEARGLGRGIKCAPIIGKWIDETGIFEMLMDLYRSIDMHGSGRVDRSFLARKIRKEALAKRVTEIEVIEIVNINKRVPLNRLIYEIEFQIRDDQEWTIREFEQFLLDYKRRVTPEKDKLITKLIMAGKYDSSYIYVLSQEAIEIIKDVFSLTPKFAEYFVVKDKFLQKLCADPRYSKIRSMNVRSETNRYVKKETIEEALIRIYAEGDTYIDIEQVLDFLSNRGRPKVVEYQVYIRNLERQLRLIDEEEVRRKEKNEEGMDSTSSDEEFGQIIRQKRINRKRAKLQEIRSQNAFAHGKKFNVTIPRPFGFDTRDKVKKVSIREQKLKEMLEEKEQEQRESMKPFRSKEVPQHVKDHNLYSKILKEQERERKQRLQKFKLDILSQIQVSDRLMLPKPTGLHCDTKREEYTFQAKPMPWYCEVKLMDRINKKKAERREKILEEIINRNTEFDVPEGVQKMIQRQEQMAQRKAERRTRATSFEGYTFQPAITQEVPNFELIHERRRVDLENAKFVKEPIKVQPFSFENRPTRSRTTREAKEPVPQENRFRHSKYEADAGDEEQYNNIPKTLKFEALVELRRQQQRDKQRAIEQQKKSEAVRRLREKKFAPYVRRVLKESQIDLGRSNNNIADRVKEFKREDMRKKIEYENEMIKIYSKVFQRPLLIESGGAQDSPDIIQVDSRNKGENEENEGEYLEGYYGKGDRAARHPQQPQDLFMEDGPRRAAVEMHHPGQYPPQDYQGEYPQGEEYMYDQDYESGAEYQGGNLHTS